MDSILNSIKKMLGIVPEYTVFDTDLIIHINAVFSVLNQLGLGPDEGFSITDDTDTWDDYLDDESIDVQEVKSYIYLKVKKVFDPPSSSNAMQAMNDLISEFEWRINVASGK